MNVMRVWRVGWQRRRSYFFSTSLFSSSFSASLSRSGRDSLLESCVQLENNVCKHMENDCLVKAGSRVLVSVSGGCDSVAMLHILAAIRTRWEPHISLEVIHFNHKIRQESWEEETFVGGLADYYGFPIHIFQMNEKLGYKRNFQENARLWRRTESMKIVQAYPVPGLIATAHHMDDQTETWLLKMLRGSHLSHLHPMLPTHSCFIRPMLSSSREDIRSYMEVKGFEWREDSSNLDARYKRNAIRHELVPILAKLAGSRDALSRRVSDLGAQSIQFQEWLRKEVEDYKSRHSGSVRCVGHHWCDVLIESDFHLLAHAVKSEYLASTVKAFTSMSDPIQMTFAMSEAVVKLAYHDVKSSSASVSLSKTWLATRIGPVVRIHRNTRGVDRFAYNSCSLSIGSGNSVSIEYPHEIMDIQLVSDAEVESAAKRNILDLNTVVALVVPPNSTLRIRFRKNGDKLSSSSWMQNFKNRKVNSVFQGLQVPLHRRDDIPIITCNNEIVAIPPYVIERCQRNGLDRAGVAVCFRINRKDGTIL